VETRFPMSARLQLSACVLILAVASSGYAADSTPGKVNWQYGPCTGDLGGIAEVKVPDGFIFVGPDDARILMEAAHNPTSGQEKGLLKPKSESWFLLFEFDPIGYVKDDEKDSLNADAILESLRKGNEEGNKERVKRGWTTMTIVGWQQEPRYNPGTNNLEWAIKAESEGYPVVNHNTRILGRQGVMEIVVVADPNELDMAVAKCRDIMQGYTFQTGQKYSEFRSGDKIAEYGLTALIAGGAAAVAVKSGLFKWIWKLAVVAFVGIAGVARRIWARFRGE
jgi:uncharacterized membrane-anchored protein